MNVEISDEDVALLNNLLIKIKVAKELQRPPKEVVSKKQSRVLNIEKHLHRISRKK